ELDEVAGGLMQLEIEREALRKETDAASRERLTRLEKEIGGLKEEQTALTSRWEAEKAQIQSDRTAKEELEKLQVEVDRAQRMGDYAKASELQYGRIPELEKRIAALQSRSPPRRAAPRA